MTNSMSELFDMINAVPGLGSFLDPKDSSNYGVQKKLIKVATDHFVRFGYRKANIAEIALGAGIGKGTMNVEPGQIIRIPNSERISAILESYFKMQKERL